MIVTLKNIDNLKRFNRKAKELIELHQGGGDLYEAEIRKHKDKRSSAINRLLWGGWYPQIQSFLLETHNIAVKTTDLHEELVEILEPMIEYTSISGAQTFRRKRTSEFSNKEMVSYMDKLENHYGSTMDIMNQFPLPKPQDLINEAYGKRY